MYYFEKLAGYIDIYVMENYNYIQLDNETFLWGKQSIKVAERMGENAGKQTGRWKFI